MQNISSLLFGDLDDFAGVGGSERTTIVAIKIFLEE